MVFSFKWIYSLTLLKCISIYKVSKISLQEDFHSSYWKSTNLSTKYIQRPPHYSELLNRHAQQDLNTFQAWPSSLDHTCFQGPEAKNNSGASKTGHQPGPGVAAGPLLSSTNSKSQSYLTLQSQKKKQPTTGFFLCQSTSILSLLLFFAPWHQSKSRNLETSKVLWCIGFKNNNCGPG